MNALHGMFLFGVAIRGTTRPKILYFYLNFFIQSFMAIASAAVALVATVRLFKNHSVVGFVSFFKIFILLYFKIIIVCFLIMFFKI